ncbi:MAG: flippase-like domain-containing protein, partial [Chloroflexi bacterium]|nr:flippase-like domain-containing protein [Chloroflexota bacterium]MBI4760294.1 flippase-like domain-containing protein [Chloroflexota bacterium]
MSKIRLFIGLVISLVLLYFTFRGLDWAQVSQALRSANYVFIALAALVILATFGVRAMRWSWLLHPVRILPWRSLFSVV